MISECPGLIAARSGVIAIVAMFVFAFTGAGDTVVATAHASDFCVMHGVPVGLALVISAIVAWRIVEIE